MSRRHRRGFTLLEVIVALGILVVSLAMLVYIQAGAARATLEAERIVTGTQLAQEILVEVQIIVEKEGIKDSEMHESGDFSDLGDEELDIQLGEGLDDYHYEWWVSEVDIGLAGDLATMAQDLQGAGVLPGTDGLPEEDGAPAMDLSAFGISNEMITEMLARFIREVRVRVWWGEDSDEAADNGDEVIIVSHVTDPAGSFLSLTGEEAAAP